MAYKKPWYWEVDWLYVTVVLGGMALLGVLSLVLVRVVLAGQVTVAFTQPTNCAQVESWDILGAPVPNPAASPGPEAVLATIPNGPPALCAGGATISRLLNVDALGATRFRVRAMSTTPAATGLSNSLDATVNLGKPNFLTVVAP